MVIFQRTQTHLCQLLEAAREALDEYNDWEYSGYSLSGSTPFTESDYNYAVSSENLRVSGGADLNNSAIYVPSSLLPSYNDVISIMDTWAESISFVNDTITFEAGIYGAEDAEIIIEITDESNIPPFISLKEIGGTNTLNFYTNAISTEDDLHYWGSGSFTGPTFVDGRLTYVVDGVLYSEPHSFMITSSADFSGAELMGANLSGYDLIILLLGNLIFGKLTLLDQL